MRLLRLSHRPDPRWDALCRQCGLCCYERSRVVGGVRIDLDRPCPYLDQESGSCTVYESRFESRASCSKVNLFHAIAGRWMPLSCGYVQRYRPWLKRRT
jgi:uncharacterized protein